MRFGLWKNRLVHRYTILLGDCWVGSASALTPRICRPRLYALTREIYEFGEQYSQRHTVIYNFKLQKIFFKFAADIPIFKIDSGRHMPIQSWRAPKPLGTYPRALQTGMLFGKMALGS